MITLSLYLFRDLCILGICTLLKMTFGTTNPLRKTPLLVLTPSENLIYRGGGRGEVGIKGNGPGKIMMAFFVNVWETSSPTNIYRYIFMGGSHLFSVKGIFRSFAQVHFVQLH